MHHYFVVSRFLSRNCLTSVSSVPASFSPDLIAPWLVWTWNPAEIHRYPGNSLVIKTSNLCDKEQQGSYERLNSFRFTMETVRTCQYPNYSYLIFCPVTCYQISFLCCSRHHCFVTCCLLCRTYWATVLGYSCPELVKGLVSHRLQWIYKNFSYLCSRYCFFGAQSI